MIRKEDQETIEKIFLAQPPDCRKRGWPGLCWTGEMLRIRNWGDLYE